MSIKTIPLVNGSIALSVLPSVLSSFADRFWKDSRGAWGLNNAVCARRIHSSTSPFEEIMGLKGRGADTFPSSSGSCTEITQDHSVPSVETVHRIGHLQCTCGQTLRRIVHIMVIAGLPRAGPTVTGNADLNVGEKEHARTPPGQDVHPRLPPRESSFRLRCCSEICFERGSDERRTGLAPDDGYLRNPNSA